RRRDSSLTSRVLLRGLFRGLDGLGIRLLDDEVAVAFGDGAFNLRRLVAGNDGESAPVVAQREVVGPRDREPLGAGRGSALAHDVEGSSDAEVALQTFDALVDLPEERLVLPDARTGLIGHERGSSSAAMRPASLTFSTMTQSSGSSTRRALHVS